MTRVTTMKQLVITASMIFGLSEMVLASKPFWCDDEEEAKPTSTTKDNKVIFQFDSAIRKPERDQIERLGTQGLNNIMGSYIVETLSEECSAASLSDDLGKTVGPSSVITVKIAPKQQKTQPTVPASKKNSELDTLLALSNNRALPKSQLRPAAEKKGGGQMDAAGLADLTKKYSMPKSQLRQASERDGSKGGTQEFICTVHYGNSNVPLLESPEVIRLTSGTVIEILSAERYFRVKWGAPPLGDKQLNDRIEEIITAPFNGYEEMKERLRNAGFIGSDAKK